MARCVHQRAKAKRRSKAKTQRREQTESKVLCKVWKPDLVNKPLDFLQIHKAKVWQGVCTKGQRQREEARQRHREGIKQKAMYHVKFENRT